MYALLVASEADEAAILSLILQRAGLAVSTARSVERAIRSWSDRPADLVVAVLAPEKAIDQVVQLRAETVVPLAVVVDSVPEELRIAMLNAGADRVIPRPYSARLMIAEMKALLRRGGSVPLVTLPVLTVAGLTLDPATHTVQLADQAARRLTHLEFRLLYTLMTHRGQVLPVDIIVQRVWGYTDESASRELVRGLVSRLRSKIEPEPHQPRYVQTVAGVGYTFVGQES